MLNIPTAEATEEFAWTTFASRYAVGSQAGYSQQTVQWTYEQGWEEYCAQGERYAEKIVAKAASPGLIHGDCGGWHGINDVKTVTALVIDCDRSPLPEEEIERFLSDLGEIRYHFQWRNGKFHLVLPLSEPIRSHPAAVQARRRKAIQWFSDQWKRQLDATPATANALLHPYAKRSESERVLTRYRVEGPSLDLDRLLARVGYQDPPPNKQYVATEAQSIETTNAVLQCLSDAGLLLSDRDQGGGKYAIKCPFHPDESHGPTSTVVFVESVTFKCFHDRCKYRLKTEFIRAIPGMRELHGNISPSARLELDAAVETVSVAEAQQQILASLAGAKPFDRTATVVRVTTGAGKTRAVAEFLSGYCAPADEESVGRSAILATPTNALLREVRDRLSIPHRTVTGVLAVLDGDGKPSCLKFEKARALQAAGGDVHRLMCAGCEWKEGCPARNGARSGEGSLTLTNHSMVPGLVKEAHGSGRLPLVVWDESPPFVEMVRVTGEDLDWFIRRFDEEDSRRAVTLGMLSKVTLFPERFRVAWRPLIEVMRRLGRGSLGEAVAEYTATRLAESHLHRAETLLGLTAAAAPWVRIRTTAQAARRVNVSEQMFDQLTDESQADVLRASGVQSFLERLVSVDDGAIVHQPGAYELSSVTEHGALWKAFGGVVLDATAPIHDLLALRPDAQVIDIAVEDKGSNVRVLVHSTALSRTRLAQRGKDRRDAEIEAVLQHLRTKQREMTRKLERPVRTLLMTYKNLVEELVPELPGTEFAHYGNLRGYDGWFQRGFDLFVTVGDPYANLEAERQAHSLLGVEGDLDDYCAYRARAELAQAHGRARAPQAKRGDGNRLALHYGRLSPLGWSAANTGLESL